jgi:hypothetical protein
VELGIYLDLNLYICLAITKIYNPDAIRRDYWWNSVVITYFFNSDVSESL